MAFLLLIVEPRGQRAARSEPAARQAYDEMVAFGDGLAQRGLLLASHSLLSDERGVRVQKRDGKSSVKDGPFAEAKEMVGGFFLLDCASFAQAVAIAESCPAAAWASVEVRETGPCFAG